MNHTKRRGVAAVEMAVVLPMMTILLMGLWEVGRMAEVEQLLSNAVREGGRQASTGNTNATGVKDYVVNYLTTNGLSSVTTSMVTVTNLTSSSRNDPTQGNQLDEYRISITVPYANIRWSMLSQLTNTVNLSASSDWYSMRDLPLTVNSTIPVN